MAKSSKIRLIFFIYWFLLAYIIAALVWWYIALNRQNERMINLQLIELRSEDPNYKIKYEHLIDEQQRKFAQYAGEGAIFLLLIAAGAIFVYRTVNRELKLSRQQQNFMMAITHELKTPIAVAKLNLETLQLRKLDESKQQRLISNTLQETNRLDALCNNLLLSSQIEAGGYIFSPELLHAGPLVHEIVQQFINRYPARRFEQKITNGLHILADRLLLQMLLNNLIDNAIKYTASNTVIQVIVARDDQQVLLQVIDQGEGIDPEDREKIFNKFTRLGNEATRRSKGTGLGLYLAKKIMKAHKASITLKSNHPKGSIFSLNFDMKQLGSDD